jgi:FAD/FMN-containing dehydrogenase
MTSMKGDGKPVSFIEDCAVPLEHLADYTDQITALFERHGTRGPGTRTRPSAASMCGRSST